MVLFKLQGPVKGLIWSTLIGFLFLPEDFGFDLPALNYDKLAAISVGLILGSLLIGREHSAEKPQDRFLHRLYLFLLIGVFFGLFMTVFTNTSPVYRFGIVNEGHGIRDFVSLSVGLMILLVPLILAKRWLTNAEALQELLRAIVILAVIYSLFILFERRMSPQLNFWLYGLQHDAWLQHVRGGGYRPMVFLAHGLEIGFFLFVAVAAAFAMCFSTNGKARMLYILAGLWLFGVLFLSRNLGALILVLLLVPAFVFFPRRMLLLGLTCVVALFVIYPMARQSQLLPVDRFVNVVSGISANRAGSFEFRLKHEDALLARALERPVFGWGVWARSRIVDENGNDVSVTDGLWIIQLGQRGWFGYITYFGLVCLPVLALWRRRALSPLTAGLGVIISGNIIYLVPNATLGPLSWLIIGGLTGYLVAGRGQISQAEAPEQPVMRSSVYSRFSAPPLQATAGAAASFPEVDPASPYRRKF